MSPHRSFAARADVETILAERGAARIDVSVLQPADPFLDTAGEELRRRIFLTQSETGQTLCLRPEFTIPVCLAHLQAGPGTARHSYVGSVFRQRRAGGNEFLQAGIEDIGDTDTMTADARAMADAAMMLDRLGVPASATGTVMGDQTVFDAVLDALGLPSGWRLRLTQAFGSDEALNATLDRLARPAPTPSMPDAIAAPAEAGDEPALVKAVTAEMEMAGLPASGGRTAQDIAGRLLSRITEARRTVDPRQLDYLRAFLGIDVPLPAARAALEDFAGFASIDIASALKGFDGRLEAMRASGLPVETIAYQARFGRQLDYYTGLVFEVRANGKVLAGGGRYDGLMTLLGAPAPVPAIGFSVWLDRVAAQLEGWS